MSSFSFKKTAKLQLSGEWSPEGKEVFYIQVTTATPRTTLLLKRDLQTGDETLLYRSVAPNLVGPSFVVSPDGQREVTPGFGRKDDGLDL